MMYIAMGVAGLFLFLLLSNAVLSYMLLRKLSQSAPSSPPRSSERVSRLTREKSEPVEKHTPPPSEEDEEEEKPVPAPVKRKSRLGLRQ